MAPALCPAANSTAALAAWQGGLFNASMQPCYDLAPTPTTETAVSAAVAQPSPWPVDQVVLADAQAQPKPTPTTAPHHPFARPDPPGTAAMPVATPAPEYFMAMARRAEIEEAEERWQGGEAPPPCNAPPCPPHTDVVWVASTKTVNEPKPTTTSCYTVTKTSTYYQTEFHQWRTTVFAVTSTKWIEKPTPVVMTSSVTSYYPTVISGPAPTPAPAPPLASPHWGCDDCHPSTPSDNNGGGRGDGWWDGWHWHWPHRSLVPPLHGPQIATLIVIPLMLVFTLFVWPIHRLALFVLLPFQLYTNLVHEIFHLVAGLLGGATICSVTIDPGCGPLSTMRNGNPTFTLLMGYTGSQLIGGLYTTLAFDERCAKIAYLIHAPLWPAVFWFTVGFWPKLQILITVGSSIALWFIWEARFLRFYILYLGLLSLFYVLWDIVDDFFFHKQNESDASLLHRLVPGIKPGVWALIFLFTASTTLGCAILAGLHFFRGPDIHTPSQHFLPT